MVYLYDQMVLGLDNHFLSRGFPSCLMAEIKYLTHPCGLCIGSTLETFILVLFLSQR